MRVDRRDGVCRVCRGELQIVDADDATMTVECFVEPDAFGDGGMSYYPAFLCGRANLAEAEGE
jgi:hypothetical protein